jgi:DNA-binding NarL/FixJ family response regulator
LITAERYIVEKVFGSMFHAERKGERMTTNRTPPRLLLADDHTIFVETLRIYLERYFPVLGIVADGRTLIEETVKLKPDIIITDIAMPLMNGFDAARKIKKQLPTARFVFLTMLEDPNMAAAALELGPIAFVLKHSCGKELLGAIDNVLHGKAYLTPKLRAEDWVATKTRARQFSEELTSRQRDIVQLLAEGRAMKEISGVLDLSVKTVEFHKHHIMESFNIQSNADLVLFALKQGLIFMAPEPSALELKAAHAGD